MLRNFSCMLNSVVTFPSGNLKDTTYLQRLKLQLRKDRFSVWGDRNTELLDPSSCSPPWS